MLNKSLTSKVTRMFDKWKSLNKRGVEVSRRSRIPQFTNFKNYMLSNWDKEVDVDFDMPVEKYFASKRREQLSTAFLGDWLIIEAGSLKVRSNDTDYKFRPNTEFTYYTGLGMDYEPDAVLVFEPVVIKHKGQKSYRTHSCILYIEPMVNRKSEEFYTSTRYGEFWIGKRPSLEQFSKATGLLVKPKSELATDLKRKNFLSTLRTISEQVNDTKLSEVASEMRLIKDSYEIKEIQKAVDLTKQGFERAIKSLPQAIDAEKSGLRGERVLEGEFNAHAIASGNAVGYETIVASGVNATTLHWIRNTSALREGELLLIDAGIEVDSLYTADITRTFPINGQFNYWQRQIYETVLAAADDAFKQAIPGNRFRDVHDAAMSVIVKRLIDLKILNVTAQEALSSTGQQHRRWMYHGTSHHLGLDVHDCAAARSEMYYDGILRPGMVFTIEPGLYFKQDDLLVPNEYRGIGVRIEDNILITETGAKNLSANIPRMPEHVESWMSTL